MLGLKRRKTVEGWAVDVAEYGAEEGGASLRERLADSNKLWVLSLIAIVGGALILLAIVQRSGSAKDAQLIAPRAAAEDSYADSAYQEFARSFIEDRAQGAAIIGASFEGPNRFRIVVPGDIGADEVDYMSKIAAWKIVRRFNHRSVVEVYSRHASGGEELISTTRWEPEKYGFVVTFRNRETGGQTEEP